VVYVGFGSMPDHAPGTLVTLVAEAARRAGVRAVLLSSDANGANDVDEKRDVFVVQRVSHAALFPRMAAIVHHGGAGTTAAALRAGVPQVVVPHFLDQYYWAHRTMLSGISAGTIARKHLTAEKLGALLSRAVDEDALRDRARAVGAEIGRTDPVARAVALMEELASAGR
jgi:UDP:flavonoid glycosyltransferase YjiC (YdhE family)